MKPSETNYSTALKALLLAVVGANFLANLRFHASHVTHLSAEAVQTEPGGGKIFPDLDLRMSPPDGLVLETAAPQPARPAGAPPAPSRAGAPGTPEAGRTGAAGRSPRTEPVKANPPQDFREDRTALDRRVPPPPGIRLIEAFGTEQPLSVCGADYDLRFTVSQVDGTQQTSVEARRQGSASERPDVTIPYRIGNARDSAFRAALRTDVARQIRVANPSCEDPNPDQETRQDRIANCEIHPTTGQALNAAGQFNCALDRLNQMGRSSRRNRENPEALFRQAEDLTAKLIDGLQAMATGDCAEGGDRSLCSLNRPDQYVRRIEAALRKLKFRLVDSDRPGRGISRGRDRDVERLIALVRQVIPDAQGQRIAERARRDAADSRDQARELAKDIREVTRDLQANGCAGGARGPMQNGGMPALCSELSSQLSELRNERADLFAETHGAEEYDRLLSVADRMNPRLARELLSGTRRDYLAALNDIRRADPLDMGWNRQMDLALNQIVRSAGLNQNELNGINGIPGANSGGQFATVINPQTGQPMAIPIHRPVMPGAGFNGAGAPGRNGMPAGGGYAQVISTGGAALPMNRSAAPYTIPSTAPNGAPYQVANAGQFGDAPPAINGLNAPSAVGFGGRSAAIATPFGGTTGFSTVGAPAMVAPGRGAMTRR